jgi:hypothetical protein
VYVSFATWNSDLPALPDVLQYCLDGGACAAPANVSSVAAAEGVWAFQAGVPMGPACDNAAGFCARVVAFAQTPRVLQFDDLVVAARACAPGYYNGGTGLCVVCPANARCVGGALSGASTPGFVLTAICAAPNCYFGCTLPAGALCTAGLCTGALVPAGGGVYSAAGAGCTSTGTPGALLAGWDFENAGLAATMGAVGGTAVETLGPECDLFAWRGVLLLGDPCGSRQRDCGCGGRWPAVLRILGGLLGRGRHVGDCVQRVPDVIAGGPAVECGWRVHLGGHPHRVRQPAGRGVHAAGGTACANAAGCCVQIVTTASASAATLSLDDVQLVAQACAPGFYNNGTGLCAPCPGGATCPGGNIAGLTDPGYTAVCGATCTVGCVLPGGALCAGACAPRRWLPPPAACFSVPGAACTSLGIPGALLAGWSFETGSLASTAGAVGGLAVVSRPYDFTTSPGLFWVGQALASASLSNTGAAGDYLRFCASTVGYTTIGVSWVAVSTLAQTPRARMDLQHLQCVLTSLLDAHVAVGLKPQLHVSGQPQRRKLCWVLLAAVYHGCLYRLHRGRR